MTIQFDEQGFALESGAITVYIANHEGIYSHSEEEFVLKGTGLSQGAYLDTPPAPKTGYAIIRTAQGWDYCADHRGETVYSTVTQQPITITALGNYPENTTLLAPTNECEVWNGAMWVESSEKIKEKFTALQAQLATALAAKTDQLKSTVLTGYPQTEIDSFYRQEREARDWQTNHESPTPMLSAIAENRGVPFGLLVEKVIEKANLLANQMGNLLGQKQAFEDRLNAAETIEVLDKLKQEIEQWVL